MRALGQWWRMRRAVSALARGKAKLALESVQHARDDANFAVIEVRALLAANKPGAARRAARERVALLEASLQVELNAADQKALTGGNGPTPLHLIGQLPRHKSGSFVLNDAIITFPDGPSAASAYQEIFKRRLYDFDCSHPPRVIDGGANIGLATIAIKFRHPSARVTCFEADSAVAVYLRRNLEAAGLEDVEVVEAALWDDDTEITFSSEGSDSGRVGTDLSGAKATKVKAVRVSTYLDERVDLLKLDIEGAELAVLRECADKLHNVERLFVEYHSFVGQPQGLPELLSILKTAGFRIAATMSDVLSPRPLLEIGSSLGMDMRLNLFGIRTHE